MKLLFVLLAWLPIGYTSSPVPDSPLTFPLWRPERQCSGEDVFSYWVTPADGIFADGFESGDLSGWRERATAQAPPIVVGCPGRSAVRVPAPGLYSIRWERRRDGRLSAAGRYFERLDCWPHCQHRPEAHYPGGELLACNGFEAPTSRFPHTNSRNVARCFDRLPPLCYGEADLRPGEALEDCLRRLY